MSLFLKNAYEEWKADPKNKDKQLSRREIVDLLPLKDYGPGRTKQAFKDSTDINKILRKAQKVGSLSHLQRHGAMYGDFSEMPTDPLEAKQTLERGEAIFKDLPSEVRKDFQHDPLRFFAFVNDPQNAGKLEELLPAIAAPGTYFPDVSPSTPPGTLLRDPDGPSAANPEKTPSASPQAASGDSGEGA